MKKLGEEAQESSSRVTDSPEVLQNVPSCDQGKSSLVVADVGGGAPLVGQAEEARVGGRAGVPSRLQGSKCPLHYPTLPSRPLAPKAPTPPLWVP